MRRAWWIATCSISHRCYLVAMTGGRFLRGRELAQLGTSGEESWFRWNDWERIFEWRLRPDGILRGQGGHRRRRAPGHGRGGGRRGSGERGRPGHGGRGGHAGEHRLLPGSHV